MSQESRNFIRSIRSNTPNPKTIERFLSKFQERNGDQCWLWKATRHSHKGRLGAGRFSICYRPDIRISAPRVQWELCMGPVDPRSVVTLECEPHCMNPQHMSIVLRSNTSRNYRQRDRQRWIKS